MGKREKEKSKGLQREDKRVGRLDEQTLGYYRRVSETISQDFENAEDKGRKKCC